MRARRRLAAVAGAALAFALPAAPATAAPGPGPRTVCRLADPRIDEGSGIALGIASPGIVYVQNDSGDTNRVFAVNAETCRTAAVLTIRGATNVDWEDLAVARDASGTPSLWIADTGDNAQNRTSATVYKVAEPRLDADARDTTRTLDVEETWKLGYPGPDRLAADTESLAVEPGGRGYLVTKSPRGRSFVYALPARGGPAVQVLRKVAKLQLTPVGISSFGPPGTLAATGAAFSRDGRQFVLRTYSGAFLWTVHDGDLPAALKGRPVTEALPHQRQGEGVTFDGDRLLLDSEGAGTPVWSVPLPGEAGSSSTATATPSSGPASGSATPGSASASRSGAASSGGSGGSWLPGIIVFVLALAGAATWWIVQRRAPARGPQR